MITRQEYNKALDIVEAYHKQLFIDNINKHTQAIRKTEWQKWSKLRTMCSTRLRNIILRYPGFYLEDITYDFFIRLQNAGNKTWLEFKNLRDQEIDCHEN